MSRLHSFSRWLLIGCIVAIVLSCSVTMGQGLGPEMYGMVGRFGMGSPVPTRVLAMGGFVSCVNDSQFANPAFAAVQEHASTGVRLARTDFDAGPVVDSVLAHYTLPLKPNQSGLQLSFLSLNTSDKAALLPGLGPVAVDMSETALVVDYGRRISGRLTAGLSVLGFEEIGLTFTSGSGPVLADVDDTAKWGFRGGLTYEWAPGDFVGVLYSFSRDDVRFRSMMTQPDANTAQLSPTIGLDFDSSQLAIGVSRHLAPNVLLAGEYQHGMSRRAGFNSGADTWNFGAEYLVAPGWALRAGANDFDFCCGVGYSGSNWRVDYACLNGWNASDVAQLLGGSVTHSFEVLYNW
jgi:hypothetical protein